MQYLIAERHLAWSSTNQKTYALRFFHQMTLGRPDTTFIIPNRRVPAKLPEILSHCAAPPGARTAWK
ncbi:hypothetical protein PO883_07600 [Massilia sp. DJPM01]|uniref:hypothetical protein n=1 Tax=Massilia sp. DJPM01 TaxID=3024404 RepID=UPI00259D3550|nr:hypothetical protein [Massilia sp. DJPM01]MDM5177060.1 hypothetical protein [Massilia sp. DJPM01]